MLSATTASFSLSGGRDKNDDALAQANLVNGGLLLAIADGIGSASHGGDAARLAINTALALAGNVGIPTLFKEVDKRIGEAAQTEGGQWGTTLSVCLIHDQHAKVGHVGDTRIYHLRGKGLQTKTRDHTELAQLIEQNILSPERALRYPRRHVLLSSMSGNGHYTLHESEFDLLQGDRVLLLSDGLYSQISKRELAALSVKHTETIDFVEAVKAQLSEYGLVDDASILCAQF